MIVLKKCDIFFKLNLSSRTILGFKNGTSYKNFHKTHSYTFSDKNEGNTDPKLINQNKNLNPKKLETTIKESDNPSETLDQTKTSHEPFNFQKLFEKNLKAFQAETEKVKQALVVIKNQEKKNESNTKILRDAILFEEILTKNVDLPIYDCLGYVYRKTFLMNFFLICFLLFFTSIFAISKKTKRKKLIIILSMIFVALRLRIVRSLQKHHIERIIYHTNEKKFTLVTKNFFGKERTTKIHKNNLMYTSDPDLNAKKINYINLENLDLYRIGYVYAWKEKSLFAYLIGQNIK